MALHPVEVVRCISLWLIIAALVSVSIFNGFKPYDDEGFFLLTSKKISTGYFRYDEIGQQYGPLYYWITDFYYFAFGTSHLASRSFQLVSCLVIAFLVQRTALNLKLSLYVSYFVAFLWVFASASRFNEAMHPAWLITSIVTFNCYLLSEFYCQRLSKKATFSIIGCGVALIFLFKPHIGILNFLGFMLIVARIGKVSILSKILLPVFFCISFVILERLILALPGLDPIFTISPFVFISAIVVSYCLRKINFCNNQTCLSRVSITAFLIGFCGIALVGVVVICFFYDCREVFNNLFIAPQAQIIFFTGVFKTINPQVFVVLPVLLLALNLVRMRHGVLTERESFLVPLLISVLIIPYSLNFSTYLVSVVGFIYIILSLGIRIPLRLTHNGTCC